MTATVHHLPVSHVQNIRPRHPSLFDWDAEQITDTEVLLCLSLLQQHTPADLLPLLETVTRYVQRGAQ